jgi:inorganic pyrophosphatase
MKFWTLLDQFIATHEIVIDRPKGSRHPRFPDMIYPFDYGYLKGTSSRDGNEIDVCRGSRGDNRLAAVVCTVDSTKKDTEIKLIVGCTDEEIGVIERFFNRQEFGAGMVIKRGTD